MNRSWLLAILPLWLIGASSAKSEPLTPADCMAAMGEFVNDLPDIAKPHVYGGVVSHDRLSVKNRLRVTTRVLTDTMCIRILRQVSTDTSETELILRLAVPMRVAAEDD